MQNAVQRADSLDHVRPTVAVSELFTVKTNGYENQIRVHFE